MRAHEENLVRSLYGRSSTFLPHDLVIDPQQRSSHEPDRSHAPPDQCWPSLDRSTAVNQHTSESPANERANANRQKCKTHVGALLARRCEPGDVFVISR